MATFPRARLAHRLALIAALYVLGAWASACGSASDATTMQSGASASSGASGQDGGDAGMMGSGGSGGGDAATCATNAECGPPKAICDTKNGHCVECLPGGMNCPAGEYCDGTTCKTGCETDADCKVGSMSDVACDPASHQCVGCAADANCPPGSICSGMKCTPGCNDQHGCAAGSECCTGSCFDTQADASHCGGCDPCPAPAEANADAVCNNGQCGFGPCHAGFGDCDGSAVNGCEADLMGQPACACQPGSIVDCYEGPVGTLGNGPCATGKKSCDPSGVGYGPCVGQVLPDVETCLTPIDDNCNGQVNEGGAGCVCIPNQPTPCYDGPAATKNVGQCVDGTALCDAQGTSLGPCMNEVLPAAAEDCTTPIDDDCDGKVNDAAAGCLCVPGSTSACYGGPAGTQGIGPCKGGTQTCTADGKGYDACVGQVLPSPESCLDNIDNDCNGMTNEGGLGCVCLPNVSTSCYAGPVGTEGVGPCKAGTKQCNPLGTAYSACVGQVLPKPESCDTAIDDDCNGVANDMGVDCVCAPNSMTSCYDGPPATLNVGLCAPGTATCNALGNAYDACVGQVLPAAESCLTPGDDNCNGIANEAGDGCVCFPSSVTTCYDGPAATRNVGRCQDGTALCSADGTSLGPCMGETLPGVETCNTPVDDNCNGQTNESGAGCVCTPFSVQSCYTGPAGTLGKGICSAGTAVCDDQGLTLGACMGQTLPLTESCATPEDDDCNGTALVCSGATPACNPVTGLCTTACDPAVLGKSYQGCDYYPVVTPNTLLTPLGSFNFAVAVSNTGASTVNVTITKGAATIATGTVAANSVQIFKLPWVSELVGATTSIKSLSSANNGAYHLVTDSPVTVYQYNPLEYTNAGSFSYTNDASLLLPTNAWTQTYIVAARNTWSSYSGFYAVVASQNTTTITATPSATGKIVKAGGGIAANGTGSVVLNKGDVLLVQSNTGGGSPDVSDVTGTQITSDKPVAVFGGHNCTDVPYNITYCDHIEESMPPFETLSKSYIVTSPVISAGVQKNEVVRIIATLGGTTTLTFEPAQAGAPASISGLGSYVEMPQTSNSYRVTGSQKILVAQYMEGQSAGGNSGDPAMAVAVPTEQYRKDYLFHAPTNYSTNFVNITAPTGTTVTLDGVAVAAGSFSAIGATGFSFASVALSNAGNGNHSIKAPSKAGITVYGYGQYTSYWYPGGLDLNFIPQ